MSSCPRLRFLLVASDCQIHLIWSGGLQKKRGKSGKLKMQTSMPQWTAIPEEHVPLPQNPRTRGTVRQRMASAALQSGPVGSALAVCTPLAGFDPPKEPKLVQNIPPHFVELLEEYVADMVHGSSPFVRLRALNKLEDLSSVAPVLHKLPWVPEMSPPLDTSAPVGLLLFPVGQETTPQSAPHLDSFVVFAPKVWEELKGLVDKVASCSDPLTKKEACHEAMDYILKTNRLVSVPRITDLLFELDSVLAHVLEPDGTAPVRLPLDILVPVDSSLDIVDAVGLLSLEASSSSGLDITDSHSSDSQRPRVVMSSSDAVDSQCPQLVLFDSDAAESLHPQPVWFGQGDAARQLHIVHQLDDELHLRHGQLPRWHGLFHCRPPRKSCGSHRGPSRGQRHLLRSLGRVLFQHWPPRKLCLQSWAWEVPFLPFWMILFATAHHGSEKLLLWTKFVGLPKLMWSMFSICKCLVTVQVPAKVLQ